MGWLTVGDFDSYGIPLNMFIRYWNWHNEYKPNTESHKFISEHEIRISKATQAQYNTIHVITL